MLFEDVAPIIAFLLGLSGGALLAVTVVVHSQCCVEGSIEEDVNLS